MKDVSKQQAVHFLRWMKQYNPHVSPYTVTNITDSRLNWVTVDLDRIGVNIDWIDEITIGNRVYIREIPKMRPDKLLRITMHSFRHVLMGQRIGWGKMYTRYATDKWREKIEQDGYAGNVLVDVWLGVDPDLDRYRVSLTNYSLGKKRVDRIIKNLRRYAQKKSVTDMCENYMEWCWIKSGAENA